MHYDNLKICNEVGVYKQGNSGNTPTTILYQQEKNALENLKSKKGSLQKVQKEIAIYPNPTDDLIYVKYTSQNYCKIEIMDVTGRKVKIVQFAVGLLQGTVSLLELVPGTYTYRFFEGDMEIKVGKITKL